MKEITLTRGKVALVDDVDFEWLNRFKWRAINPGGVWYAMRELTKAETVQYDRCRRKTVLMHVFILGRPGVDHKDRDGLNNQRENLRAATPSQQNQNMRRRNATGFKGVCQQKSGRFSAYINPCGLQRRNLGTFDTREQAALAYNAAAEAHFGDYACLNTVE